MKKVFVILMCVMMMAGSVFAQRINTIDDLRTKGWKLAKDGKTYLTPDGSWKYAVPYEFVHNEKSKACLRDCNRDWGTDESYVMRAGGSGSSPGWIGCIKRYSSPNISRAEAEKTCLEGGLTCETACEERHATFKWLESADVIRKKIAEANEQAIKKRQEEEESEQRRWGKRSRESIKSVVEKNTLIKIQGLTHNKYDRPMDDRFKIKFAIDESGKVIAVRVLDILERATEKDHEKYKQFEPTVADFIKKSWNFEPGGFAIIVCTFGGIGLKDITAEENQGDAVQQFVEEVQKRDAKAEQDKQSKLKKIYEPLEQQLQEAEKDDSPKGLAKQVRCMMDLGVLIIRNEGQSSENYNAWMNKSKVLDAKVAKLSNKDKEEFKKESKILKINALGGPKGLAKQYILNEMANRDSQEINDLVRELSKKDKAIYDEELKRLKKSGQ